eukprot:2110950-Prymnesium_polylepis.1
MNGQFFDPALVGWGDSYSPWGAASARSRAGPWGGYFGGYGYGGAPYSAWGGYYGGSGGYGYSPYGQYDPYYTPWGGFYGPWPMGYYGGGGGYGAYYGPSSRYGPRILAGAPAAAAANQPQAGALAAPEMSAKARAE